jgi:hypothetical protein
MLCNVKGGEKMKQSKDKFTVLYLRLSGEDDEQNGESNSTSNRKMTNIFHVENDTSYPSIFLNQICYKQDKRNCTIRRNF